MRAAHRVAMRLILLVILLLSPNAALACERRAPVTILISIDGFRADYLDRGITPAMSALAAEGARGTLRPSFPTKTYPNHWAIVTGLHPDRSGIVANKFEDAARPGQLFTMEDSEDDFWWREATPLWVSAEQAGIRTGILFWPGSQAANGGVRPSDWWLYAEHVGDRQRVDGVIDWLRRPKETRPRFVTLYFDAVDTAGHDYGPDSAEVNREIKRIDAEIGRLRHELAVLGQPANLVVVADHGMMATAPERVIMLKDIADPADFRRIEHGPYAALEPRPGREDALARHLLRPLPHARCWRKGDLPARLRYGKNPRVPAFICIAEPGWVLLETLPEAFDVGNHGYDNEVPEMRAILVVNGPAFRRGVRLPLGDTVDVYPLLRRLVGLPPVGGIDGTDRLADLALGARPADR
jgi:predicted AlkP superfamily pyrophosphatase or phosphodiesterase